MTKEPNLVITRIFQAPRELVFRAWTDPRHVAQWWGPKNFTAPSIKIDFRKGGKFLYCMRAPDGQEYWNGGEFLEVEAPKRIVQVMYFSDALGNKKLPTDIGFGPDFPAEMRDVITFEEAGPLQTKLTLVRSNPLSVSKKYMEDKGWGQSLDKFEEALRDLQK